MKVRVYYDQSDIAIDPVLAHEHFDRQLIGMNIDAQVTMIADARLTGRRPLLVMDGGMLGV